MKFTVNSVVLAVTASVLASAFPVSSHACSQDGKDGFLPPNNLYIPPRREILDRNGNPEGGGITQAEFNGVIDVVERIYTPIVKAMGGNLHINRFWTDGTVNAYADREDGNWNISMFGGLARHRETTIDSFLLVVCHELGHQIGGAPKYGDEDGHNEWAGNEGQSDYWATLKCARRVLAQENNLRALDTLKAPAALLKRCQMSFATPNQAAGCVRTSMAGVSLARLLASLGPNGAPAEADMPWFTKRDKTRVTVMYDAHPPAQCRLDTYYSGSICMKDFREDVSQTNAAVGTCRQEEGDLLGYRPRCWYALDASKQPKPKNPIPPKKPFRGRVF